MKTKREAPALTAFVLYRKHVEWLFRFGRLYYSFMQQLSHRHVARSASPPHTLSSPGPTPPLILSVLSGVIVEKFDIVGLDVAIYRSEKHPVGIRTFIGDKVSFSGTLLHQRHEFLSGDKSDESHTNNLTKVRRLSLPGELSEWIIRGVYDVARDIQVRVCSAKSGSRGESLVLVKEVTFRAGGGGDGIPVHDGKLLIRGRGGDHPGTSRTRSAAKEPSTLQQKPGQLRREASKPILDHFAIAQHNPYHFRDSDTIAETDAAAPNELADGGDGASFEALRQMGFLLGLFSREARVLVTFSTLEALVDIAENWFEFITAHCPELLMPKPIERKARDESGPTGTNTRGFVGATVLLAGVSFVIVVLSLMLLPGEEGSPKKTTSLAEDPKFGKIFDAYVKSSDGRRGSRDATTNDKSSSVSLQQTQDAPATDVPSLVDPFLVVQFVDFQISIHDHAHKVSVVLVPSRWIRSGLLNDLNGSVVYCRARCCWRSVEVPSRTQFLPTQPMKTLPWRSKACKCLPHRSILTSSRARCG